MENQPASQPPKRKPVASTMRTSRLRTTDPARLARRKRLKDIQAIDVGTGKFRVAEQLFETLLDRVEAEIEGRCVVMIGRTGAGKTHIIRQLIKRSDLQPIDEEEGLYRPLLLVTAPAPCTLRTLGSNILKALTDEDPARSLKEYEVWERVRANFAAQRVAILVIDEMHNVLTGRNTPERAKIAQTLKMLMVDRDNPMQIVIAGLPKLRDFVKNHRELHRRHHFIDLARLDPVKDSDKLEQFLTGLEGCLGLKKGEFTNGAMPERFFAASRGLLGRVAFFAQEAAVIAASLNRPKEVVKFLETAYERCYACGKGANPFAMPNVRTLKIPKSELELDEDEITLLRGKKKVEDDGDNDVSVF